VLSAGDPSAVLLPLVAALRATPHARVRVILLERLAGLLPAAHARKPLAAARHALPTVFAFLEDPKPDVKTCATDALLRAAGAIGVEGVLEAARQASLTEGQLAKVKKALLVR
jgi:hypothetical protein